MYNPNYGHSAAPSHQQPTSLPFSSTPTNVRSQRPRFGYPGPSDYPRPRSSASKPNPVGYPESDRSPYGTPEGYLDNMRSKYPMMSDIGNPYEGDYPKSEDYAGSPLRNSYGNAPEGYMNLSMRSIYGSASDNLMNTPPRSSFGNSDAYVGGIRGTTDSMVNNYGNSNNRSMDTSFSSMNNSFYSNNNSSPHSQNSAYFTCNESFYESPKRPLFSGNSPSSLFPQPPSKFPLKNAGYNADNRPDFQRRFQNKKDKFKASSSLAKKPAPIYDNRRGPRKQTMASKSEWQCTVCSIEFTSGIPYDMHLRGAKHAKKLKLLDALQSIQSQVAQSKEIAPVGKSFRCELCNITANSSLQLQTHLDGTKHKTKLLQQQQSKEKNPVKESEAEPEPEVNGKSNGAAVVRPLPAEFGEPQQAKMCKYSCEICNLILNSEIQLQQHLTSKKHQAKVEGKPILKRKFKRKKDADENEEKTETEEEADQKTGDNATESSAATETTTQESTTSDTTEMQTETSNTGEARKMVVGVKTLSASFVQGDTLK